MVLCCVIVGNGMVFSMPFSSNAMLIGDVALGSPELQEGKSSPLMCNKAAGAGRLISITTELPVPVISVDIIESCRCAIEEIRSIDSRIAFSCSMISAN